MRKFEIGDNVLIRTDLVVNQIYKTDSGAPRAYFTKQMTKYKGKKLLIVGKDYKGYICSYNGEILDWSFVEEMFDDVWE
jgi:hypothetical protein